MATTKIIAMCDFDGVRVGYICINKEKHLAWFTDYEFNCVLFPSINIGDVVENCEALNIVVTPLKK
jgi:hypothetical protein